MIKNKLLWATTLMISAQVIYAFVNFSYDVISNPWNPLLPDGKMDTSAAVFWQYFVATIFAIPLILRIGFRHLKTSHPVLQILRAMTSAVGVQVFVFGFALGVPVWQMVGLLLTGPFWVILGSVLFLGERLSWARVVATICAFAGALIIVGVGEGTFSMASLLPVFAAILWSATTVITKYLSAKESPESLTIWLLVMIVVCHLVIGIGLAGFSGLFPNTNLSTLTSGFSVGFPQGETVIWVMVLGFITALSNYLLWSAYSHADASYLQPLDDLKLPINVLIGWVFLNQIPVNSFWLGAILIVAASIFVTWKEGRK